MDSGVEADSDRLPRVRQWGGEAVVQRTKAGRGNRGNNDIPYRPCIVQRSNNSARWRRHDDIPNCAFSVMGGEVKVMGLRRDRDCGRRPGKGHQADVKEEPVRQGGTEQQPGQQGDVERPARQEQPLSAADDRLRQRNASERAWFQAQADMFLPSPRTKDPPVGRVLRELRRQHERRAPPETQRYTQEAQGGLLGGVAFPPEEASRGVRCVCPTAPCQCHRVMRRQPRASLPRAREWWARVGDPPASGALLERLQLAAHHELRMRGMADQKGLPHVLEVPLSYVAECTPYLGGRDTEMRDKQEELDRLVNQAEADERAAQDPGPVNQPLAEEPLVEQLLEMLPIVVEREAPMEEVARVPHSFLYGKGEAGTQTLGMRSPTDRARWGAALPARLRTPDGAAFDLHSVPQPSASPPKGCTWLAHPYPPRHCLLRAKSAAGQVLSRFTRYLLRSIFDIQEKHFSKVSKFAQVPEDLIGYGAPLQGVSLASRCHSSSSKCHPLPDLTGSDISIKLISPLSPMTKTSCGSKTMTSPSKHEYDLTNQLPPSPKGSMKSPSNSIVFSEDITYISPEANTFDLKKISPQSEELDESDKLVPTLSSESYTLFIPSLTGSGEVKKPVLSSGLQDSHTPPLAAPGEAKIIPSSGGPNNLRTPPLTTSREAKEPALPSVSNNSDAPLLSASGEAKKSELSNKLHATYNLQTPQNDLNNTSGINTLIASREIINTPLSDGSDDLQKTSITTNEEPPLEIKKTIHMLHMKQHISVTSGTSDQSLPDKLAESENASLRDPEYSKKTPSSMSRQISSCRLKTLNRLSSVRTKICKNLTPREANESILPCENTSRHSKDSQRLSPAYRQSLELASMKCLKSVQCESDVSITTTLLEVEKAIALPVISDQSTLHGSVVNSDAPKSPVLSEASWFSVYNFTERESIPKVFCESYLKMPTGDSHGRRSLIRDLTGNSNFIPIKDAQVKNHTEELSMRQSAVLSSVSELMGQIDYERIFECNVKTTQHDGFPWETIAQEARMSTGYKNTMKIASKGCNPRWKSKHFAAPRKVSAKSGPDRKIDDSQQAKRV